MISKENMVDDKDCMLWAGYKDNLGYASMGVKIDGRWLSRGVHRVFYELWVGSIPEGLVLDHLCRNPPCFNPDHLEAVTQRENILRGVGATAQNARKTHCHRGHPLEEWNIHSRRDIRSCKQCAKIDMARLYKKRVEEGFYVKPSREIPEIVRLAYDTGGFPVGKKQLAAIGNLLTQYKEI